MASAHLLKISRLEGLTDGIFAIAMTIMVLNLHIPEHLDPQALVPLLKTDVAVNLLIYIGSFVILGTHWIAMNFQWGLLDHLNRTYLWANMYYLMVICVVPFSADLLGVHPYNTNSIDFYAINLLCASFGQFLTLQTAHYYKLFKKEYTRDIYFAALHRLLIAPLFYVAALMISNWSIGLAFLLLVLPTVIYMKPGKIDKYETI
jgi:uncharacterized membrane protein